jgi:hypothetical protein
MSLRVALSVAVKAKIGVEGKRFLDIQDLCMLAENHVPKMKYNALHQLR